MKPIVLWLGFAAMCLVMFMAVLDIQVVASSLTAMQTALDIPLAQLGWIQTAYLMAEVVAIPLTGILTRALSLRMLFALATAGFVAASLGCATSPSFEWLIAARVVQGFFGGMLIPSVFTAVFVLIPRPHQVLATTLAGVAALLAPTLGPLLGGWLTQTQSWHWIFLINVPIGVVGMAAVLRFLPDDSLADTPRFDLLGCALLSACMVAFSLALDVPFDTQRGAWSAALFLLAAATVLGYWWHARGHARPLFRLGLFGEPNFSIGLAGNLVCRIGSSAVPFLLPLLLQVRLGYSPLHAGMLLLPAAIAGTIAKPWIAPLVKRYGYDRFLLVNTAIVGASIVSFALITPGWPLAAAIVQLAVFGASNSMQFAAMNSVTLKGLRKEDAGSGNSLFSMVQMLAIGLGVTIGGTMVNAFKNAEGLATNTSFQITFVIVGVITLVSAWVFRRMDPRYFK